MSAPVLERPSSSQLSAFPRAPRTLTPSWTALLIANDVTMFVLAFGIGSAIAFHHWDSGRIVSHLLIAVIAFVALWLTLFARLGLYTRTRALSVKDELYYTVTALILGTIPQLVLFTLYPGISTSRLAVIYALAISIVLVGATRSFLHEVRNSATFRGSRRTTVVGRADRVRDVVASLQLDEAQTQLVSIDDLDQLFAAPTGEVELRRMEWFAKAREWHSELLVLTEIAPPEVVAPLLQCASREHMKLAFAPPRIQRYAYELQIQTQGRQALIVPNRLPACTPRAQLLKRVIDISCGTIALLVFGPVMLLAAIAIVCDSGLPIFYEQERVGADGSIFHILKFRSMRLDAEKESGAVWASQGDPRTTRVGAMLRRFSIDEMPQLFNVLRGDMSLVGPRPERPIFVDLFRRTLPRYDERHLIAPGITGWSQMHMKRILEPSAAAEKLAYDLYYLENWSLFLDISILFQTLCEFLFQRAG